MKSGPQAHATPALETVSTHWQIGNEVSLLLVWLLVVLVGLSTVTIHSSGGATPVSKPKSYKVSSWLKYVWVL